MGELEWLVEAVAEVGQMAAVHEEAAEEHLAVFRNKFALPEAREAAVGSFGHHTDIARAARGAEIMLRTVLDAYRVGGE